MTQTLYSILPLGSDPDGAIVGERPRPHAAVVLGDNNYLTTGPLEHGQSGDAGSLGEFTVEGWVQVRDTLPGSTIDLFRGPPGGGGAIQWRLRLTSTGTLEAIMRTGSTGATTATATTAAKLALGNWYYLVATVTASTMRIYIDGVQSGSVAVGGDMPLVDSGGEMRVGDSAMTGTELAVEAVAFHRSGLDFDRVTAHFDAGRNRGYPAQLSGARIAAILDTIGSHAPRRIDPGVRQVAPSYMQGQAPLDEMRNALTADAVDAMLYIGPDGAVVYLDADHRASAPYNTVQATFDDDGTDLSYHPPLGKSYSDSFLGNEWNVTWPGEDAVTQTVSDQPSIDRRWKSPQSINAAVTTDADAATIAAAMLAKYKDPMDRLTPLALSTADPDVAEAIFRRDLGDRIRVFRTPPGGGTRIDLTLFIQKITIDAAPGLPWRVTWGVSPV